MLYTNIVLKIVTSGSQLSHEALYTVGGMYRQCNLLPGKRMPKTLTTGELRWRWPMPTEADSFLGTGGASVGEGSNTIVKICDLTNAVRGLARRTPSCRASSISSTSRPPNRTSPHRRNNASLQD